MLRTTIAPAAAVLPSISWRWEAETDILSGSLRAAAPGEAAVALELSSPDGAVVVLDVVAGELCGLDIVIWPEVETIPALEAPAARLAGRVLLPAAGSAEEADLAVQVDGPERTVHLRVGHLRATRVVRIADQLIAEIDDDGVLAGLWLTGVPPFPTAE
jgi:hypothetical protein